MILKMNLGGSLDLFVPLPNGTTLSKTPFSASTINVSLNWLSEDGQICLGAHIVIPPSLIIKVLSILTTVGYNSVITTP